MVAQVVMLGRRPAVRFRMAPEPAERQYNSMRMTLIGEVKSRVLKAGDGDSGHVVRDMEGKRLSKKPPLSIDKVIKTLMAAKKTEQAVPFSPIA